MIDHGMLAGISATMAFYLAAAAVGTGLLTWRWRKRFARWSEITARDRADACLNVSLLLLLLHSSFHRAIASWSFAVQEWQINSLSSRVAPGVVPIATAAAAIYLWWMFYEIHHGREARRWWWWGIVYTGLLLGAGVSWLY